MARARFAAIVLAAQRDGRLDPLAASAGVTHKGLVPIGGKPLLQHVLEALAPVPGLAEIRIAVEEGAAARLAEVPGAKGELGLPVLFTAARATITDSIYAAAEGSDGPFLITTADNVLLSPGAAGEVAARLAAGDDAVVAMTTREAVLAAHPEGQRRFYRFADAHYSNCNLYALSRTGLRVAETFRTGGQFAKNPMRIAAAFGLHNLVMLRLGWLSLDRAMRRLGRRFGIRASAVVLADGAHAVDVDNERTYEVAALLLAARTEALSRRA
jgi:GTP:adenosylcobinamide-phosphate guanylyltransferase